MGCKLEPSVRSFPIYPGDCGEPNTKGVRLRDCKEVVRKVEAQERRRVCTKKTKEQCPQPCPDCPPTHSGDIATHCRRRVERECVQVPHVQLEVEVSGEGQRLERQVLSHREKCRDRQAGQQCSPVTCRFVDLFQDCVTSESEPVEIVLTDRLCQVCQPRVAEQVSLKEVCKLGTTRSCEDNKSKQLWRKFCTISDNNNEEKVKSDLETLLDPVNKLFGDSSKGDINKNSHISNREPKSNIDSKIKFKFSDSAEENDISDEYDNFREILPSRRRPQTSVYFAQNYPENIPVLNSRLEENTEILESSETLMTENKEIGLHSSSSISVSETTTQSTEKSVIPITESIEPYIQQITTEKDNIGDLELNSEEFQTKKITTEKVGLTEINLSKTSRADEYEKLSKVKQHLQNEDFLRNCLLFGKGCDFDLNSIDRSDIESTSVYISPKPTTEKVVTTNGLLNEEKLKFRLQCLFKQNCDPELQIYPSTLASSTTTRSTPATTRVTNIKPSGNKYSLKYEGSVNQLKCLFNHDCERTETSTASSTSSVDVSLVLKPRGRVLEEEIRSRAEECFARGIC